MENKNKITTEVVLEMLAQYKELKLQENQLKFEIDHLVPVATDEEIIESMSFNSALGEKISSSTISDKTANIALSYIDRSKSLALKHKKQLEEEYNQILFQTLRLEYYVDLLDTKQAMIIKKLYFEGRTLSEVVKEAKLSSDTVKNTKRQPYKSLPRCLNGSLVNR